jgi:hypothetical protein
MWASDSPNTNARETQTHVAINVIHAWTHSLPLQAEYQANKAYTNMVHNDQFKHTSASSSVTPTGVARFLTQPHFLNPLPPELNPSTQHCLMRFSFTEDFAS